MYTTSQSHTHMKILLSLFIYFVDLLRSTHSTPHCKYLDLPQRSTYFNLRSASHDYGRRHRGQVDVDFDSWAVVRFLSWTWQTVPFENYIDSYHSNLKEKNKKPINYINMRVLFALQKNKRWVSREVYLNLKKSGSPEWQIIFGCRANKNIDRFLDQSCVDF